jgi:hypothetical protein
MDLLADESIDKPIVYRLRQDGHNNHDGYGDCNTTTPSEKETPPQQAE